MITTDIVLYPGHPTLDYFLEIVNIFAFFGSLRKFVGFENLLVDNAVIKRERRNRQAM